MCIYASNLSVFLVKQPNLKFKPARNYTPTLHVFSMAAPTVSVRAREQIIWACYCIWSFTSIGAHIIWSFTSISADIIWSFTSQLLQPYTCICPSQSHSSLSESNVFSSITLHTEITHVWVIWSHTSSHSQPYLLESLALKSFKVQRILMYSPTYWNHTRTSYFKPHVLTAAALHTSVTRAQVIPSTGWLWLVGSTKL